MKQIEYLARAPARSCVVGDNSRPEKLWSARAGGSLHPRVTAQAFARATDRRIHDCSSRRPMS